MSPCPNSLFCYGTLMMPAIREWVMNKNLTHCEAELKNHRRFCVKGKSYPGITYAEGQLVKGVLIENLTSEDWLRLDEFEGIEYQRIEVEVQLTDRTFLTQVYLYRENYHDQITLEDWSPEKLKLEDLT